MTRKFTKIDGLLSYLGGLFGLIALAFGYLFRYYNQCCFELEICDEVFREGPSTDDTGEKSESDSDNTSE